MDNLNYGIIGNCRSAALISHEGSLDWCCLPQFDSASVFAKLLDEKKGGSFEIVPSEKCEIHQEYFQDTAILVTRFTQGKDVFELHDFMPRHHKMNGKYKAPPEIIRYVKHISGTPKFSVKYDPKLEYAVGETEHHIKNDFIASLTREQKYDTL
ncbi:MAG: glycoside hydrolase family 15 protein, partial [Muricauda sp.]|nr:glycoside hydrolase family 15 protein [Allomuricauda sp.]